MKVLFSLTYFWPYNSGLTNYVLTLAEMLSQMGKYKISVMCMKHDRKLSGEENIKKVRVIRANPLWRLSKGFISVDWIFKSFREVNNTDILVVNLPQIEALFSVIWARIRRKRVISIYHARVELRGGINNAIIQIILEVINYLIMSLSYKVVAYTHDYSINNHELKRFIKKTVCIYPPIKIPEINNSVSQKIKDAIPKNVKVVIGMAARLAEDKGFENMIMALPLLEKEFGKNRICVLVAGSLKPVGEEKYRTRITRLLESVKNKFIFLDLIPHNEIGSFYKNIDVLIVPSILESFGIVQVESMMMGVPVVTSNLPGARVPICRTGMGYLAKVGNINDLAEKIIYAIHNRKKLSTKSEVAKSEFDINKTIDIYCRLFEKL